MIDNPDVHHGRSDGSASRARISRPAASFWARSGIYDAYHTGRGRIVVRAKTEIEPMPNGRQRIVVTEIPYMVNKAKLVEKIAELVHDKRLDGISDIRDESDRDGHAHRHRAQAGRERRMSCSTTCTSTRRCRKPSARSCWRWWTASRSVLNLQADALPLPRPPEGRRRPAARSYDLDKAEARAHILEGLLIALDHIDEIVSHHPQQPEHRGGARTQLDGALRPVRQAGAGHSGHASGTPDRSGTREVCRRNMHELQKTIAYFNEPCWPTSRCCWASSRRRSGRYQGQVRRRAPHARSPRWRARSTWTT